MNDNATLSLSSVLVRADDLRFRQVLGEGLAVKQSTAAVVGINEVEARIVELIDGNMSIDALLVRLLEEYEVDRESLEADLLPFLKRLLDCGVINEVDDSPP